MILKTLEDREEAENAESLISGEKRLTSERDGTEVIYNLFGQPSGNNFYKLNMFNLPLLQQILDQPKMNKAYDEVKHQQFISMFKYAAKSF